MNNSLELFANVLSLDRFDKPHFGVQLVERLNAFLQDSHPFFLGTLFVPQTRSTPERPHPLVVAFVEAAVACTKARNA